MRYGDKQGNNCWKLSRTRYKNGWFVAFKFSCLGATVCFYPNQPYAGITPSAHALFQTFCDRCSPALDLDEAEAIWQSASKTPATASRPLAAILSSIRWWQLGQRYRRKSKPKKRDRGLT